MCESEFLLQYLFAVSDKRAVETTKRALPAIELDPLLKRLFPLLLQHTINHSFVTWNDCKSWIVSK